jgi:hypothetical protein
MKEKERRRDNSWEKFMEEFDRCRLIMVFRRMMMIGGWFLRMVMDGGRVVVFLRMWVGLVIESCEREEGSCEKEDGSYEKEEGSCEREEGSCEKEDGSYEKEDGSYEKEGCCGKEGCCEKEEGY